MHDYEGVVYGWENISLKGAIAALRCSFNFLFIISSTWPMVNKVCCSPVGKIPDGLMDDELIHVDVDSTRDARGTV